MKDQKPRAIIFDAFDVLISDGIRELARKLAREKGLADWPDFFQTLPFWRENWQKLWLGEMNEDEMEVEMAQQIGKKKARCFFAGWDDLTKADQKMLNLVRKLKRSEAFKLGLLSNTPPKLLACIRKEIPLDLFDEAVFSCQVGLMKPDPLFFKLMVKKIGVKPEKSLFIDDSQKNVAVARELGMEAVQFKSKQDLEKKLKARKVI